MAARTMFGRRAALRGLTTASAVACTHLWVPGVRASDVSLGDRVDLIYSNRFHFGQNGEPQVTVGLMEGETEVHLSAPKGLRVLPSGDGGTSVLGGTRWHIRLLRGKPAKHRYTVFLEQIAIDDGKAITAARKRWEAKGLRVREIEVGTVFGVGGRVLDTRKLALATEEFSSEEDAGRRARVLSQRHGALGRVFPIVDARSQGGMIATDLDHGVQITAEGVLWFSPVGEHPVTVHNVLSGKTIGPQKRSDRAYRGNVYVAIDRQGTLAVVNQASETEVLSGLVPAEIFASAPAHALMAQAVAARGQLVAKVGTRHLGDPYLLCAHQHCQVYAGMLREHEATNDAVAKTRGRILMRPNQRQLVDTVYSANCGGHTEHNEHVWPSPPDPQLRGRPDPKLASHYPRGIVPANLERWLRQAPASYSKPTSARLGSAYRWRTDIDPNAIAGRGGVPEGLGRVHNLEVLARGYSGRATRLRIEGKGGAVDLDGELAIRRALGNLRSSMFVIEGTDRFGRFKVRGGGHGHGVGLCQHGAMGMAGEGRSHAQILAHYYRRSELVTLW